MRPLLLALGVVLTSLLVAEPPEQRPQHPTNSPMGTWHKIESPSRNPANTLTIVGDKLTWEDVGELLEADYSVTKAQYAVLKSSPRFREGVFSQGRRRMILSRSVSARMQTN